MNGRPVAVLGPGGAGRGRDAEIFVSVVTIGELRAGVRARLVG